MEEAERIVAEREGRKPRTHHASRTLGCSKGLRPAPSWLGMDYAKKVCKIAQIMDCRPAKLLPSAVAVLLAEQYADADSV